MCKNYTSKEYESEEHSLFTFKSEKTNKFCIFLNAVCVHSCKTFSAHQKKLNKLIEKYNLIQKDLVD